MERQGKWERGEAKCRKGQLNGKKGKSGERESKMEKRKAKWIQRINAIKRKQLQGGKANWRDGTQRGGR